jgi:hypothetical protein
MIFVLIVAAMASPAGPATVVPIQVDFDLAKVRSREATCGDPGQSDDIVVCAPKGMDLWLGDTSRFAVKPLRAAFTGPLNAETTIHVIQHSSPVATTPAAAVTFRWRF